MTGLLKARFTPLGVVLRPNELAAERGILNPACARLGDGMLQLYPRIVADGNVSRIGSFRVRETGTGEIVVAERIGIALEPEAPYELRARPGGYGCEDPRVTFLTVLDRFVMAYVALGPRGPEVAVAISPDGLTWTRLGLLCFRGSAAPFADKDAAFFPEPVISPAGIRSIALYHRPTSELSLQPSSKAVAALKALPPEHRDVIAIAYIPLDAVLGDIRNLCNVTETHRIQLPPAQWGLLKVGAGTPPVRVREGWLSVIHGVDEVEDSTGAAALRYCAGIIVHEPARIERLVYRSERPLFEPGLSDEYRAAVGYVVFPTAIDRRSDDTFDVYYGMADRQIGRGRLELER